MYPAFNVSPGRREDSLVEGRPNGPFMRELRWYLD